MNEVVTFVATRLLTRAFWLLVLTTLLGWLMVNMRTGFRDEIFQAAAATRKRG